MDIENAGGHTDRDWPTRVWARSSWACTTTAAASAAICVATFLAWLSPWALGDGSASSLAVYGALFVGVVVLGLATTVPMDHRRAALVQRWVESGGSAADPARRMVLGEPFRQAATTFVYWAIGTVAFTGAYAIDTGALVRTGLLAIGAILGGLCVASIAFLVSEASLRPLYALALHERIPRFTPSRSVGFRLMAAWAVGSGIPLLGIALALAWRGVVGTDMTGPLWALVITAVGAGFLVMLSAARSVARPVEAVRAGLGRVEAGTLDAAVVVDTTSELGHLQAGFNAMAAGLVEREQLRELAAEEHARRDEVETESRQKSLFLASMSHELRTPLNAIIGFTDVLSDEMFGPLNGKQKEYLGDVLESARHLLALINDVLDLSKIEAGRVDLDIRTVNVHDAVGAVAAMFREEALQRGITLTTIVTPPTTVIDADERLLKQVLINLVSNAMRFSPDGGPVSIVADRDGDDVVIAVSDRGPGIAPSDRERIFEEFRQGPTPAGGRGNGTGLGLALARKFVDLHAGHLTVASEVGEGSTFTCRFPSPLAD